MNPEQPMTISQREATNSQLLTDKLHAYASSERGRILKFDVGGTLFATFASTINKKIQKPIRMSTSVDTDTNNNETQTGSKNASVSISSAPPLPTLPPPPEYYRPNLLEALISGVVDVRLDDEQALFIDRNPAHFGAVIDFLRKANTAELFTLPADTLAANELLAEAEYYGVDALVDLFHADLRSRILSPTLTNELLPLCHFANANSWTLLYRASLHGFDAQAFHERCDAAPRPTLTVIQTTLGHIFGGYTRVSWSHTLGYKRDPAAFIFSLVNRSEQPVRMASLDENSIYCNRAYGPTFGIGHSIFICTDSNVVEASSSNLGRSYAHQADVQVGTEAAREFLAETHTFLVREIEVYLVD